MILEDIDSVVGTFDNKVYSFGAKHDANETALTVKNGQTMIFLDVSPFSEGYTPTGTQQFKDNRYSFRIVFLRPNCSDDIDDDANNRLGTLSGMRIKCREFANKLKNKNWGVTVTNGAPAWKEFEGKMSGWYIDITATKQFEQYNIPC